MRFTVARRDCQARAMPTTRAYFLSLNAMDEPMNSDSERNGRKYTFLWICSNAHFASARHSIHGNDKCRRENPKKIFSLFDSQFYAIVISYIAYRCRRGKAKKTNNTQTNIKHLTPFPIHFNFHCIYFWSRKTVDKSRNNFWIVHGSVLSSQKQPFQLLLEMR